MFEITTNNNDNGERQISRPTTPYGRNDKARKEVIKEHKKKQVVLINNTPVYINRF